MQVQQALHLLPDLSWGGVISLLPTGYTQLEYISTTGSDYFDTGIDILSVNAIESPAVEIKYNTSKTQTWIFGQRSEADDFDEFGLYISSDTSFLVRTESVNKTRNYTTTGTHTVKMAVGNFECDGSSSRSIIPWTQSNGECSLAIGGMNTAGVIENECFVGDIYYCNLYVDDTIIHQYVPCKNASGQVGLYDVVTQTFIQSQNNKFTAGPAV